jgi:serine/threonine-protein kinase
VKQPAPGVIITGKYRLERPLASGGMGSVWVARHVELGLPVAIKFIGPELASSSDSRMRFDREAKAAALIQSPYVVSVQDYGVDDHLPYIVMELMRGEDLEERLRRRGRIPLHEASAFFMQIAKGLRRAHEMGIIHRDLKPRNLFIAQNDDEETIKILDFGIAKSVSRILATEATTTGNVMGSPFYMSPEQIRGARDIDLRTDLWSLGVVLFQMLTATLPFHGEVVGDIIGKILADPIPIATHLAPDLPPAIDDFFARALARDRAHRFQSAREMADALADIARSSVAPHLSVNSTVRMSPLPTATTAKAFSERMLEANAPTMGTPAAIPAVLASAPAGDSAKHTTANVSMNSDGAPRSKAWRGALGGAAALAACVTTVLLVTSRNASEEGAAPGLSTSAPALSSMPPGDFVAPASDQAPSVNPETPQVRPQEPSAAQPASSAPAGANTAAPTGATALEGLTQESLSSSAVEPSAPIAAKPSKSNALPPTQPRTVAPTTPTKQPPPSSATTSKIGRGKLGF